jgi:23S rRNA pseudouridine1911/1915/1917 synthase
MVRPSPNRLIVPQDLAGERLDRAIAHLAVGVSRGEARRLIAAGVVFVEGHRTKICARLMRAGERIGWEAPMRRRARGAEDGPRIVCERPELWIVDKPAGMPVEPTRAGSEGTLADWLLQTHGQPFVTHRLDAATSGLIVVARNRRTQVDLNRCFAAHSVGRRYLAVVAPCPAFDGRPAVTHATVVVRSELAALLVVELETGRPRQIRRHLADAGFPVIGEDAAGHRTNRRLLLHAFLLVLPWPGAKDRLTAGAAPPADFLAAAAALKVGLPDPLPPEIRFQALPDETSHR